MKSKDKIAELSKYIQEWCGCMPDDSVSLHDAYFGIAVKSPHFRGLSERVVRELFDIVACQQEEIEDLELLLLEGKS